MARRILISCWGSFGDVLPCVGLAQALQARGHTVTVATGELYRQTVEQVDAELLPVGPPVDPADRALIARLMHPAKGSEAILRELLLPALEQTYEQLRGAAANSDLVVSHPITFAAPIAAEHAGVPWVSTVLAPLMFFSATDMPVLPQAPWLVHARRLGPWIGRALVRLARANTRRWMTPVHALRVELGLHAGGHPLFEGAYSPHGTLALFSRLLAEPQPDWPPRVRVTGFVFYNGTETLEPRIEEFLASGPPPVVFTLGTSAVGAAGRFYHESAAAAAALGVRAVLLAGDFAENRPRTLPEGVLLAEHAPHQLLFPRAAAVVHHGGVGTTGQALGAGHPMLIVPHSHDQPDNAYRVGKLGVSRTVYPRRYRAKHVARELDTLLRERHYGERAQEVAAAVRREGGAAGAAAALDELVP